MLTCFDIAKYFLTNVNEDYGDNISNLKLQKLVYYAQGFYLALYDKPLFREQIKAWTHGPVVPALYKKYKDFGAGAIPIPQDMDFSIYDEQTKELLDDIFNVFGQFSAWKLRNMTHTEPPWKNVSTCVNNIISHKSMKEYFKTRVNNG